MKSLCTLILALGFSLNSFGQSDAEVMTNIYEHATVNGKSYEMLEFLSTRIGHRLSGSPQAAAAVDWTYQKMKSLEFDTVFLQPVMVPHWVRGEVEIGRISNSILGQHEVSICALGNSIGTGENGLLAKVVEVKSFEELENLGEDKIKGKIVFFNRPMDPARLNTFAAYGGAVNQRGSGPSRAAALGAVGAIVRSMTLAYDDVPHTGSTNYSDSSPKIPAIAISTMGADLLSRYLKEDPDLDFYFETHCEMLPEVLSYNVIGEIQGSEHPDKYIITGGHLDSWDKGDGSHDDGAGCIQSIEALRLIQQSGIKPKHTFRAVMFMNEENGLRGGRKYAKVASNNNEVHIAAIESDRGGFVPRGFSIDATDSNFDKMSSWADLFEPYEGNKFFRV